MTELESLRWFTVLAAATLGALVGSFSNVLIYRVPRGQSVSFPPSRCPNCQHRLGVLDLFPIFSWLFLGGKCRYCKVPISERYPTVEAITALGYGVLATFFPVDAYGITLLGLCVLFTLLLVGSAVDIERQELPDVFAIPGIALGLGFAVLGQRLGAPELAGLPNWIESVQGALLGAGSLVGILLFGSWVMRRFGERQYPEFPINYQQVALALFAGVSLSLFHVPGALSWALVITLLSVGANVITKKVVRIPEYITLLGTLLLLMWGGYSQGAKVLPVLTDGLAAAGAVSILAGIYWWRYYASGNTEDENELYDPEAMGFGDIKWMAMIGAFLGWERMLVTLIVAVFLGTVVGLVIQIVQRRWRSKQQIPFGPYLSAGALVALLWGPIIWDYIIDFTTMGSL